MTSPKQETSYRDSYAAYRTGISRSPNNAVGEFSANNEVCLWNSVHRER